MSTQYEALVELGASELPEGYAYRVGDFDREGDRLIQLVTSTGYGYWSMTGYSVYSSRYLRWMVGDRRAVVWTCRLLARRLARVRRRKAREVAQNERLHLQGPLR